MCNSNNNFNMLDTEAAAKRAARDAEHRKLRDSVKRVHAEEPPAATVRPVTADVTRFADCELLTDCGPDATSQWAFTTEHLIVVGLIAWATFEYVYN